MPSGRTRDPYVVLGLTRSASTAEMAAAHRRLAKSHHPDLHDGGADAASRMREINEAWEILSTPERRAAWDIAHPLSGTTAATSHWTGSRQPIRTAESSRAQVNTPWRTAAGDPRSARRGILKVAPRPPRAEPAAEGFLQGPWAAILAGAVGLGILMAAILAGRLAGV